MDRYGKLIKKALLDAGCTLVRRGKGDHEVWYSPISDRHVTVDDTPSRHTANETLKQAGLPKRF